MFLLNSRHSLFFEALKKALFIPKLQSQIAEFLQNHYLFVVMYSTSSHAFE